MANETILTMVGNLTADPELQFVSTSGMARVRFTIASTPRTFDRESGAWKDGEATFMSCTAWRDLAENIAESLTKGTRVIVTGRLRQSRWEDKETGEKRQAYGLDVDEIGPSLRFAQAKVNRLSRTSGKGDGFAPDNAPEDGWTTPAPQAMAGRA